ncbi:MAG: nucleotidyltransferase family protein [Pseudomonadota bacterium]
MKMPQLRSTVKSIESDHDVMVLAAGLGKRLRPLTDHTPKPLIQVGNRPLIDYHLEKLSSMGFHRVIINLHHLGEQIREHVTSRWGTQFDVVYSDESAELLETAGGIRNALPYLRHDKLIVINSDVVTDFDFRTLALPDDVSMNLVLVKNPDHHPGGDFCLAPRSGTDTNDGPMLLEMPHARKETLTFSGIGVYSVAVFKSLQIGRNKLAPVIHSAIACKSARGLVHPGLWMDVGTEDRLEAARKYFR